MKKIRNRIYLVCGWSMIVVEFIYGALTFFDIPKYSTMIAEIRLLDLFGLSWLVKREAFPFLNDK